MSTAVKVNNFDIILAAIERRFGFAPTHYQQGVYRWLLDGKGHGVVNAVAGSGKTTTLEQAVEFCVEYRTLLVSFNRHIADELASRIARFRNATSGTLHSIGFRACRDHFKVGRRGPRLDNWKTVNILKGLMGGDQMTPDQDKLFRSLRNPVKRIIALFKAFGYGYLRPHADQAEVEKLADRYGVVLPTEANRTLFFTMVELVYAAGIQDTARVDYDDMLFMPIAHDLPFPTYDRVFVDEAQDLNPVQVEIIGKLVGNKGRAIFVGDRHQAIYGFRGADPEAIQNIIDRFDATELPLSICWRCPSSVVELAQSIVPEIEAAPNASVGEVVEITDDQMMKILQRGDYVLCRTMAPLVTRCLMAIREGFKAVVKGRDIGEGLITMLDSVASAGLPGGLHDQIEAWGEQELAKLDSDKQAQRRADLDDRIATLLVLTEGCKTFGDMEAKIEQIFSDQDAAITFSTIHRAKGLENERILIMKPHLLPYPNAKQEWELQQEENLRYVAITRSLQTLIWVHDANLR